MSLDPLPLQELLGGRFELLAAAGRGGMSTVYRALDRQSGTTVAVKLLLRETKPGSDDAERFRREASILAELRHPGIVSYIDSGTTSRGQQYLAMEWLDGEDLSQRLRRGPLTINESVNLVRRVAEALQVAHHQGIVHRDLKPSNIFLRQRQLDGVALLDFGIARLGDSHANLTMTGAIIGTPEYMAPEQARGQHQLTSAVDVFALGCVLFECLTRRPPFAAEQFAVVLAKILFEPAPALHSLRPGASPSLGALIQRLLSKDPRERPADAEELLAALGKLGAQRDDDGLLLDHPQPATTEQLASVEQQLICLVLASPTRSGLGLDETMAQPEPVASDQATLCVELGAFGGVTERLRDGSLMAVIRSIGSLNDQVIQAARCALLIQDRWPEAAVGLAIGPAVVVERMPLGEVAERAASLVRLADQQVRAGVRIDPLSAQLLDGRFEVERLRDGAILRGERNTQDELRPLLGKPTPCVGREYELRVLESALAGSVLESTANEMLIVGAPGSGKSRLRHEFLRKAKLAHPELLVLIGRGDPMTAGSPYAILGTALSGLCGILRSEPLELQQRKLRERLERHLPADDKCRVITFLGELCGVRFASDEHPQLAAARKDPRVMSDQVTAAFVDWLRAETADHPLGLILEDLHWGDGLSVQLFKTALESLAEQPLLVLTFARPEVSELFPKLASGRQQELRLRGLSRNAAERLIREVLGKEVTADTVKELIERADGNALYLEELIRAVAEGKHDSLPETVLAMLQARLSRLDSGQRRLSRVASIFGLTFWDGAVRTLLGSAPTSQLLEEVLEELVTAEVIRQNRGSRFPEQAEFCFRHPLMRDAAYGLLSEGDRQLGHRLAGRYLEEHGESDAALLAEHYRLGQDYPRAVACYIVAAQHSVDNNDLVGALERAERGLGCHAVGEARGSLLAIACAVHMFRDNWEPAHLLGSEAITLLLPGSRAWTKLVANLFVVTSLTPQRRPQFEQLIGALCSVAPAADARTAYVEAMAWLGIAFSSLGLRNEAQTFLALLEQGARPIAESDPIARGWLHFAQTSFARMLGRDPRENLRLAQLAATAFAEAGDRRNLAHAKSYVGLAEAELGDLAAGEQTLRQALELTQRLGERLQAACASVYLATVLLRTRQPAAIDEALTLARTVAEEPNGNFFFAGIGYIAWARALLLRGEATAAEPLVRRACAMLSILPTVQQSAVATLVDVLLATDRAAEAQTLCESLLPHAEQHGGYGELGVRLAAVRSRFATGDSDGGRATLQRSLAQLELWAEATGEPAARERFLRCVEEAVELRRLAAEWLA